MTRPSYPKPPIAEAVIDFRFPTTVTGEALVSAVKDALGDSYSGEPKTQEAIQVQASLAPGSVAATASRKHHLTLLASADNLRAVGCGDGMLSIHVLPPYPGWEQFSAQVREVLDAVSRLLSSTGLHQIAIRYIDRMPLPLTDELSFNDFITAMPAKPDAMPEGLSGFHFVTQTTDAMDGTMASLILASAPPTQDGMPVVLYDLTLRRAGAPLCSANESEWSPIVEVLHERQRDIFEGSITDRLRETFR